MTNYIEFVLLKHIKEVEQTEGKILPDTSKEKN